MTRVRCTLGLGDMELYIATRHLFVTYAIEQLDLSVDDIGWYCGHRSAGGRIVRDHYLHPDDQARRERIAEKFKLIEQVHRPAVDERQPRPDATQRMRPRDANESPNRPFAGTMTCRARLSPVGDQGGTERPQGAPTTRSIRASAATCQPGDRPDRGTN